MVKGISAIVVGDLGVEILQTISCRRELKVGCRQVSFSFSSFLSLLFFSPFLPFLSFLMFLL